jgi:hypothetical protein
MTHWIERIDQTTGGAILAEHIARYDLVRPLVAASSAWADLGCGTAVAAQAALAETFPEGVLIADADEDALAEAGERLATAAPVAVRADLATEAGVGAVAGAFAGLPAGPRCVTCFEVVEHLSSFTPLIEWLTRIAAAGEATVVLSVPNDVHSGVENPYHLTRWGEGAVAELRGLLPRDHLAAAQIPLSGSGIAIDPPQALGLEVALGEQRVPSHFILAFGPQTALLESVARVAETDLDAWRTWEIQREAELAYFKRRDDSA